MLIEILSFFAMIALAVVLRHLLSKSDDTVRREFDAYELPDTAGMMEAFLQQSEASFAPFFDEQCAKHVVWAKGATKTPLCVVNLHGWSASPRESEPFPTELAERLGANLYHHRLPGHALSPNTRSADAMGEITPESLLSSAAQALKIGTRLGDQLILVGCSTGGSLVTWLLAQPWAHCHIAGAVLISPAFAVKQPAYDIMKHVFHNLPRAFSYSLLRTLLGKPNYSLTIINPLQPKYWTTTYPIKGLLAIFELYFMLEYAIDYEAIVAPVFVLASSRDTVVSFKHTEKAVAKMTRSKATEIKDMAHAKGYHTIVGDIFNEAATNEEALEAVHEFLMRTA